MADVIVREIERLKREKNAVILAHNYQLPEVQDIADFNGDSLELSRKAADTDADVIIFCGVDFMAENAKILSPQKKVLIPVKEAACPMAAMITADQLRKLKSEYPGVPVLTYVNTSAEVKAESDVCCTSANLVKIAGSIDSDNIIVTPDKHLANYLQTRVNKKIIAWNGYCPTHAKILPEHIREAKSKYPEARVLVHPECRLDVIELADEVSSTSGMIRYAQQSEAREFIIATEIGMIHRLKMENPGKDFYPATELAVCSNMKRTNIHSVLQSLREMNHQVDIPEEIRTRAKHAIDRMLELS